MSAPKIITLDTLIELRKANSKSAVAPVFAGSMDSAAASTEAPVDIVRSSKETAEIRDNLENMRHELQGKIKANAAYVPTAAEISAYFGTFMLDVTRRAAEAPDLTSLIATEQTNYEFPESIQLNNLLPFRGVMGDVSLAGDSVPLIEQKTGNTDTLTLAAKALGWKDTLKNLLFNKFFTMDKVVQAAVDAYTDERNKDTVGTIVGATYVASQTQAAVSTAGLTLDEKTYETILAAVKKLRGLKDPQTGRFINAQRINILCNSQDTWQIANVVAGQLNGNGSSARVNNRPALPINQIVEYDQGINDGFVIGKVTASFPGVAQGTFYLYVPGVMMVATKRPLTMETGRGSVLELSTEERAWYTVKGVYSKMFLGSSYAGTGLGAGYGSILKVSLPS